MYPVLYFLLSCLYYLIFFLFPITLIILLSGFHCTNLQDDDIPKLKFNNHLNGLHLMPLLIFHKHARYHQFRYENSICCCQGVNMEHMTKDRSPADEEQAAVTQKLMSCLMFGLRYSTLCVFIQDLKLCFNFPLNDVGVFIMSSKE